MKRAFVGNISGWIADKNDKGVGAGATCATWDRNQTTRKSRRRFSDRNGWAAKTQIP